jgi:alkaline phosphatase D
VPLDADAYKLTQESVAVELVGTSITSDNFDEITGKPSDAEETGIRTMNPHVKMVELDSHGYSVCEVTKQRIQFDWYCISDREDPKATQSFATAFKVEDGSNKVTEAEEPIS